MSLKNLIKQCKKGQHAAQEELYHLFAPQLFAVCLKYSRNRQEAKDNFQESFITIFENIEQYKNKGSFEGWLKRITINTSLQKYRKQTVFKIIDESKIEQKEEVNLFVDKGIDLDFLLQIIQELPDRYRMVFNLYALDGYSHKEIAGLLNISEGTSKSNLARARQKLKERIINYNVEESMRLVR